MRTLFDRFRRRKQLKDSAEVRELFEKKMRARAEKEWAVATHKRIQLLYIKAKLNLLTARRRGEKGKIILYTGHVQMLKEILNGGTGDSIGGDGRRSAQSAHSGDVGSSGHPKPKRADSGGTPPSGDGEHQ